MHRVLVAGATGYLGGFVARELKDRGHFVRALARSLKKLDPLHDSLDEFVEAEIDVGGPETMTWDEAAAVAFEALDKPEKTSHVPEWLMWLVVRLTRLFNRHQGDLLAFFTTMATTDVVAPPTGTRTLEAHYRSLEVEA